MRNPIALAAAAALSLATAACGPDPVAELPYWREDASVREPPDAGGQPDASGCARDPAVMARYSDCAAAQTQQRCEESGGSWTTSPFGDLLCSCPTGEAGCECTSGDECVAGCFAPLTHDPCPARGRCAESTPRFGCTCTYEGALGPMQVCFD